MKLSLNRNLNSGIYAIIYNQEILIVGSTSDFISFMNYTIKTFKDQKYPIPEVQEIYNEFGDSSLVVELIHNCPKDLLEESEKSFIEALNPKFHSPKKNYSNYVHILSGEWELVATDPKDAARILSVSAHEVTQALASGEAIANKVLSILSPKSALELERLLLARKMVLNGRI